jgi:hypothetical protein
MYLLGDKCRSCGKRNPRGSKFCKKCGTALRSRGFLYSHDEEPAFDWKWMGGGVLIITATALLFVFGIKWALGARLLEWPVGRRLFLLLTVVASSFFVGGIVVGRMSAGVTLKEPAVAGALSCVIVFAVAKTAIRVAATGAASKAVLVFDLQLTSIVLMLPVCIGLAYVGGWVGEKWQGTI